VLNGEYLSIWNDRSRVWLASCYFARPILEVVTQIANSRQLDHCSPHLLAIRRDSPAIGSDRGLSYSPPTNVGAHGTQIQCHLLLRQSLLLEACLTREIISKWSRKCFSYRVVSVEEHCRERCFSLRSPTRRKHGSVSLRL
jgi:hypothetical protein